ncbi:B3 domain-containing transcription factor VRN1-like [Beta vulgaris subsp. vulgaris]|uniref:B3 domain-containing transcription factor VRN1-like n=1 Tax=Beta vulgaris subsp. vulgaris TaxID=3555 RepID=UPI0020372E43|nr:B3 domain-containing transcription factor VRN1-like [Beta vulgaris subsp. vulgaris]
MRSRRKKEGNKSLEKFGSRHYRPSCFFKLMLSPSSQFKKLRIPKNFARKLRNEDCNVAILNVPTGETRKVELVEEENELWFGNGWQEFVEYFSIGFAYFLVFKYQGNSNFLVHIFNLTACEITYPCNASNNNASKVRHDPCVKGNEYDKEEKPEISQKKSDVQVQQLDSEDDRYISDNEEVFNARKGVRQVGNPLWFKKHEELLKVAIAAGISMPKNPFFVADMKPYVLNKGFLNIPLHFGRRHLRCKLNECKLVKLEAYDGSQWEVNCFLDYRKMAFRQGWMMFARHIGLEAGDICAFELINAKKYVFKVHVAKSSQVKPYEAKHV